MPDVEQKTKRNRKANPDRITLGKDALQTLVALEAQVEKAFGGMVRLKNKELTNFVLEVRNTELSASELRLVKERYFDEVRAATWALQKLKEAKGRGERLKLKEILAQIQTPVVKERSISKKAQGAKSERAHQPPATPSATGNGGQPAAQSVVTTKKLGV